MLFYIVLFIICMVLAAVIVYMYRAISGLSTSIFKDGKSHSNDNLTAHINPHALKTTINNTPTPWGWGAHENPSQAARATAAAPASDAPWGWPGNDRKVRKHQPQTPRNQAQPPVNQVAESAQSDRPVVGWPYREENIDSAGNTYKVTRKVKSRVTARGRLDKPWGW